MILEIIQVFESPLKLLGQKQKNTSSGCGQPANVIKDIWKGEVKSSVCQSRFKRVV